MIAYDKPSGKLSWLTERKWKQKQWNEMNQWEITDFLI